MKSLIICGGLGTRIQDITKGQPKHLLSINGESIIGRLIRQLNDNNISEHYLALSNTNNLIEEHLTLTFPQNSINFNFIKSKYSNKGNNFLHTLTNINPIDDIIVIMGDNVFFDVEFAKFIEFKICRINMLLVGFNARQLRQRTGS